MGIKYPPSDLAYPFPKGVGRIGVTKGKVLGRVTQIEPFKDWGDYMRVIDWVKFNDGHRELRFAQFYRKPGGGIADYFIEPSLFFFRHEPSPFDGSPKI